MSVERMRSAGLSELCSLCLEGPCVLTGGPERLLCEGSGQQGDSREELRAFQGQKGKPEGERHPTLPVPQGAA